VVDYRKRAEECRELVKLGRKPEDWTHFLEMAQTWEALADLQEKAQSVSRAIDEAPPLARSEVTAEQNTLF
jgi:hypothetical protein